MWSKPLVCWAGVRAGLRIFGIRQHYAEMELYRRRLQHRQPEGTALFIAWSLFGGIPGQRYPQPGALTAGQEIDALVAKSILYCAEQLGHYQLHSRVVMGNHIHMFVTPYSQPAGFMQSLKTCTAAEANRILDRVGQRFWQHES